MDRFEVRTFETEGSLAVDLAASFGAKLNQLPWSLRILLENCLRRGGVEESARSAVCFSDWLVRRTSREEISFFPHRMLMHDTTCVPALVDIAGTRDALAEAGRDPGSLNPTLPVDVSVDHSIAVDAFGRKDAVGINMARELSRNSERFRLMKWAENALAGFRVHPPGTGILHTLNLEQFATIVTTEERDGKTWVVPDTLVGTDSHTPMINGLGVLAWGVGGLEAEAALFGLPIQLRIPDVIGVRLTGRLTDGVMATDAVLLVTERLRKYGVSGQFVEFFGPGVSALSAGERSVIANMAPEFGATTAFFPTDGRALQYLLATARPRRVVARAADYAKRQLLCFDPDHAPNYTDVIEIDLGVIRTSVAGPRRPQDRLDLAALPSTVQALGGPSDAAPVNAPPDGAVAIAAITSCTNTTDPRLLIAAGLVARKARNLGLRPPGWVKTSLSPGSPASVRYLARTRLLEDLSAIGFEPVGFGCMTCIGNSGPLAEPMESALGAYGTTPVAVLSGNRNFPGRVHAQIEAAFLASPPLVVAFALAGDANRNISVDPIGMSAAGRPVYLRDLWPTGQEIDEFEALAAQPSDFVEAFREAQKNTLWADIPAPETAQYPWDAASTYIRRPPFTLGNPASASGKIVAAPLLVLGDDVTTDQISPAGAIPPDSAAARYLVEKGENARDLNVFASRRGNFEVMVRGLFTNRGVKNLIGPDIRPGFTVHASGETILLTEAAARYAREGLSTVIIAGERYGGGSSRDWAAKGPALLGVRAVLARSFERIHRQNLIGMGIAPLILPKDIGIGPSHLIEMDIADGLKPGAPVRLTLRCGSAVEELDVLPAVETEMESDLLRIGGIVPYILRHAAPGGAQSELEITH